MIQRGKRCSPPGAWRPVTSTLLPSPTVYQTIFDQGCSVSHGRPGTSPAGHEGTTARCSTHSSTVEAFVTALTNKHPTFIFVPTNPSSASRCPSYLEHRRKVRVEDNAVHRKHSNREHAVLQVAGVGPVQVVAHVRSHGVGRVQPPLFGDRVSAPVPGSVGLIHSLRASSLEAGGGGGERQKNER